jgi:hypothetical protein
MDRISFPELQVRLIDMPKALKRRFPKINFPIISTFQFFGQINVIIKLTIVQKYPGKKIAIA